MYLNLVYIIIARIFTLVKGPNNNILPLSNNDAHGKILLNIKQKITPLIIRDILKTELTYLANSANKKIL